MADSDLDTPRKRRRPAQSCEQCRRRKIRCDQNMPCGSCVRARASLQCSYRPDSLETLDISTDGGLASESAPGSVLTPDSSTVSAPMGTTMPQPQYNVDTAMQQRRQGDSITAQHEKTIHDLRHHVQQLEAQLASLRQSNQLSTPSDITAGQRAQPQPKDRVSGEPSQSPQASDTCIPATLPRLRNAPDKTKLFGQSHWVHTAEKVRNNTNMC
jgi:hypothetical protein